MSRTTQVVKATELFMTISLARKVAHTQVVTATGFSVSSLREEEGGFMVLGEVHEVSWVGSTWIERDEGEGGRACQVSR